MIIFFQDNLVSGNTPASEKISLSLTGTERINSVTHEGRNPLLNCRTGSLDRLFDLLV